MATRILKVKVDVDWVAERGREICELWDNDLIDGNDVATHLHLCVGVVESLSAEVGRYRNVLQEIVDATPENDHRVWKHHHWYLVTAREALDIKP